MAHRRAIGTDNRKVKRRGGLISRDVTVRVVSEGAARVYAGFREVGSIVWSEEGRETQ